MYRERNPRDETNWTTLCRTTKATAISAAPTRINTTAGVQLEDRSPAFGKSPVRTITTSDYALANTNISAAHDGRGIRVIAIGQVPNAYKQRRNMFGGYRKKLRGLIVGTRVDR